MKFNYKLNYVTTINYHQLNEGLIKTTAKFIG